MNMWYWEQMALQRAGKTVLLLLALFASVGALTACGVGVPVIARSGSIYLQDPVMAKGADELSNPINPTTRFLTNDKRIYCTIAILGPDRTRLGARWYYGEKQIGPAQYIELGPNHQGAWWLEMPPGKNFPVGEYRVEIFLVDKADKVAHSTVANNQE